MNKPHRLACSLVALTALSFAGCAQYATIAQRRPRLLPPPGTGVLAKAEGAISRAIQRDRSKPLDALGEYLTAVASASEQLQRNPNDAIARRDYNFAVARVFEAIQNGKLDPWTQPLRVPAEGGDFVLTHRPEARKLWSPALYDFTPADQFDVKGTYVSTRTVKEGLGAPLVAVGKEDRANAKEDFAQSRIYYGVTAVARVQGRRVEIAFEDPLATEAVTLGGHTYPMAADFTVPLAVMLARENPKKLEMARLLQPGKYAETAHIVRLQPYDPNKTVVIVTHGLMDSPATWAPMLNTLRGDAEIRRRYQFWFYSYPSGYPYPYSASIMRHQLDAIEKKFPLQHKIVLIGHSMGGCISRLMITDSGDQLWMKTFGKPPGEVNLSPETKQLAVDSLIFRHRPEVGRVIFISAPHRGSDLASNWMGRIGSSLVRAPSKFVKVGFEMRHLMTADTSALRLDRLPNSVDTLAPNNRFVKNLASIPITPGIPYHSIMGDRGRGDTPNSSDGIVPYWSSHLDGAQSELIVPSHHSAHQNPKAIAEVMRILKQTGR